MCKLTIITCLVILGESVFARTFDQRQTGDLNVQVDVKNLKIFALTKGKEEYVLLKLLRFGFKPACVMQGGYLILTLSVPSYFIGTTKDYDYAYDYSEMTIKPQNGTTTTIKPLNTAVTVLLNKDNATAATDLESTTQVSEKITTPSEHVVAADPTTVTTLASTSSTATNTTFVFETPNTTSAAENSTTTIIDCKKGFYRNKGNCELKLQNPSNILLKMLQKSKSSGGNGIRKP